jgi:hypothetical protein
LRQNWVDGLQFKHPDPLHQALKNNCHGTISIRQRGKAYESYGFQLQLRSNGQSKAEMVLTPLFEGMRVAGAHVEVVNLSKRPFETA